MSVNFSTIGPMSQSTISKPPAFVANPASQPPASSSMDPAGQPKPKKSHWFRNTLLTAVVLAAATGLGRKYMPKTFDPKAVLASGAKWHEQGLHYAKKYIGVAGEFINTNISKAYVWAKNIVSKPATPTAPTAP